jgi:ATP-dependent RNA helicase RhlE
MANRPERPSQQPVHQSPRGKNGRRPQRTPQGPPPPIRCLVLAPTRELAAQIGESFAVYGQRSGMRHTVIYGGVGQNPQVNALRHGVDILVATPGRLLDLKNQGHVDLSKVEVLILDEADQMLDMGFLPDLRRIVAAVPQQRQTLMFSATMPETIRSLAERWLHKPDFVKVDRVSSPTLQVKQSLYHVQPKLKPQLLVYYLKSTACERTLVFSRTKHGADKIVKQLNYAGIPAEAIHGNKSQNARMRALAQFKSDRPPVLVATDIAARGLDVTGISHVINYELPEVPETYVHRIGRTGRAGATGFAVSFCGGEERGRLQQIERLTRKSIPLCEEHPEYSTPAKYVGAPEEQRPPKPSAGGKPRRHAGRGPQSVAKKSGAGKPAYGRSGTAKSGGYKSGGYKNAAPAGNGTAKPRRSKPAATGAAPQAVSQASVAPASIAAPTADASPATGVKKRRKPRPGKRERQRAAAAAE